MSKTLQFFRFFFVAYRWQSLSAIGLLATAGLLEGIGILTLIPMLEVAVGGDRLSGVGAFFVEGLAVVAFFEPLNITHKLGLLLDDFIQSLLKIIAGFAHLIEIDVHAEQIRYLPAYGFYAFRVVAELAWPLLGL